MKRKYGVTWYEYELTNLRCRNFFTRCGASLFAWYLMQYQNVKPTIYEIGE